MAAKTLKFSKDEIISFLAGEIEKAREKSLSKVPITAHYYAGVEDGLKEAKRLIEENL